MVYVEVLDMVGMVFDRPGMVSDPTFLLRNTYIGDYVLFRDISHVGEISTAPNFFSGQSGVPFARRMMAKEVK